MATCSRCHVSQVCQLIRVIMRKALQPVISSNGVSYLQMRLVGSHSISERKKGRNRKFNSCCPWSCGLQPKKFQASVAVPPAPVRVSSQRPLAPSITSGNLIPVVHGAMGCIQKNLQLVWLCHQLLSGLINSVTI